MSDRRLIWALLKKNMRRGYWNGGPIFIALGLLVSMLDWKYAIQREDEGVWILIIIGVCILSFAAGIASFSTDLNQDNIYFLEYLPVRHWHIWLANCADGALTLAALIVALCWHRTLFFTPPTEMHGALLDSRWTLLLVSVTVACWFFASGVFYRTLFQRDVIALVMGALPASIIWLCGVVLIFPVMGLIPSLAELAPLLWLTGLMFLFAGLLVFALAPPYRLRPLQRLGLGVSVTLAVLAVGMTYLLLAGMQWKELSPAEDLSIYPRGLWPNQPTKLLATVESPRSLQHTVCIDLDTGQYRDLGRNLGEWAYRSNVVTFIATRTRNSLFPSTHRFVSMAPDGERTELKLRIEDGQDVQALKWSEDGQFLVFVQRQSWRKAQETPPLLVVADRTGEVRVRVPISKDTFSLGRAGYALAVAPFPGNRKLYESTDPPTYLWVNLNSGATNSFQLPGDALAFAPDLSRVVCVQSRVEADRQFQSVVLLDLRTNQKTVLFSERDIPVSVLDPEQTRYASKPEWYYGFLKVDRFDGGARPAVLPAMGFDDSFNKAVTISETLEGDLFTYTLLLVDLNTGQKKVLVGPEQMPKRHVSTPVSFYTTPRIYGFSRNADSVLCKLGQAVVSVDTATGQQRTLMKLLEPTETNCVQHVGFSPSRRRLCGYEVCQGEKKYVLTIIEDGIAEPIYVSRDKLGYPWRWLDEDRIVLEERGKLWMIHADGTGLRQLFPLVR